MKYKNQLCWGCQRALGGCCWSALGKPVKGWDAEETVIKEEGEADVHSFNIKGCPLYIADDPIKRLKSSKTVSIYRLAQILGEDFNKFKAKSDSAIKRMAKEKGITVEVKRLQKRILYVVDVAGE